MKALVPNEYDEKKVVISSLGIYELRGLARVLGIKSPTTKVRDELIEEILNVIGNGQIPASQISKKGRPFKQLANLDVILNSITGIKNKYKPLSYENIVVFNQEVPVFKLKSNSTEKMTGVLRNVNGVSYFIDLKSSKIVFVDEKTIQTFKIVGGDLLEVEAFRINDESQYFVKTVLKINCQDSSVYKSSEDYNVERIIPSQFLKFDNGSLLLGGRNIIFTNNQLFMCPNLKTILERLEKHNAFNIFIGFNLCFEDKFYIFSRKNFINFVTDYSDNTVQGYDRIIDAISFASRLISQSKNINLIVYDSANIIYDLDKKFKSDNGLDHELESILILKKLISLAFVGTNEQCVTVLTSINEKDKEDDFIKNEIIKVSNFFNENQF